MDQAANHLAEISKQLQDISRLFRAVMALAPGMMPPVPGLTQVSSVANLAQLLLNPKEKEVVVHQTININIGEGQISERAFWDNLVMRHILPSFERTGLTPAPEGGAG